MPRCRRWKNRSAELLPKPTAQTNLIPSIIFSFFVLAPSAPADGDFQDHSRGCRTEHTYKRTDHSRRDPPHKPTGKFVGRVSNIAQTTSSCPANLKLPRALRIRPKQETRRIQPTAACSSGSTVHHYVLLIRSREAVLSRCWMKFAFGCSRMSTGG